MVAVGVGTAWGISAVIAGASSAYYNEWLPYRRSESPSWATDLQYFAGLLFPLGIWWIVLAMIHALGPRRSPARYVYLGAVVGLVVLMTSDVFGRGVISPLGLFDHLATPRFIDDVVLALIGLLALALTATFARRPKSSLATRD